MADDHALGASIAVMSGAVVVSGAAVDCPPRHLLNMPVSSPKYDLAGAAEAATAVGGAVSGISEAVKAVLSVQSVIAVVSSTVVAPAVIAVPAVEAVAEALVA